jgi:hypothetical protein
LTLQNAKSIECVPKPETYNNSSFTGKKCYAHRRSIFKREISKNIFFSVKLQKLLYSKKQRQKYFFWMVDNMYRKNSLIALAPKNHPKQTSIPKLPKYLKALKKII